MKLNLLVIKTKQLHELAHFYEQLGGNSTIISTKMYFS
ncbi:MAG: hypothetical protein RLZZ628_3493 [Bacteroidota bacterium]|jgi:hypothetical protein